MTMERSAAKCKCHDAPGSGIGAVLARIVCQGAPVLYSAPTYPDNIGELVRSQHSGDRRSGRAPSGRRCQEAGWHIFSGASRKGTGWRAWPGAG